MISQNTFVVVDCETTGLISALDKIIEIGAVKVVNGEIIDEFYTMVNPGVFVPSEVTHITGITTDMLAGAPDFKAIAKKYMEFMGDAVFVAHNVVFDRGFLNQELSRNFEAPMGGPFLCTIDLARYLHPNLSKYALGPLCEHFAVDLPQAHRAIHDARATAGLLIKFLRSMQNGGVKDLRDIPVIQNMPKKVAIVVENQISLF